MFCYRFLSLSHFYAQITERNIEDEVSVILCNEISKQKHLVIAKATDKKIVV
ncbi:MAG: hypothetical protein RRX92_02950 [Lachnospiraceae bacterium]